MDEYNWKSRIMSNKTKLCDLTSISLRFLDECVERQVLTGYDKEVIESVRIEYDKNSKFYDILLKKGEKHFGAMLDIMKETETRQSEDVINILAPMSRSRSDFNVSSLSLSFVPPKPPVWFDVVQPQVEVIGRETEILALHNLVTRNSGNEASVPITSQLTCVSGLGGIGKTTLVRMYAIKYREYYDGNVIWIKPNSEQDILNSFKKLTSRFKIITEDSFTNPEDSIKVFEYFSDRKSLFIFDNVEIYMGILDKFIPLNLGWDVRRPHILMTSRKDDLADAIVYFKLRVLTLDDATNLITNAIGLRSDKDKCLARDLAVELEFLPLALQQAISYIRKLQRIRIRFPDNQNPLDEYLELLTANDHKVAASLLDFRSVDDYGRTVFRTWATTMKVISNLEHLAEKIMSILAYFNPDSIKCDIVETIYDVVGDIQRSLNHLVDYSMIDINHGFISIHRLVQQVIGILNQSKSTESDVLKQCLTILMKRSDVLEHSYTIWKSALKYTDLIREFPRVGIRLCENVHFGSTNSTNIFQETFNKFNDIFGSLGVHTMELNCVRIISLCHDVKEPDYELIFQLTGILLDDLYDWLDKTCLGILPMHLRVARSLLSVGVLTVPRRYRRMRQETVILEQFDDNLYFKRINFRGSSLLLIH